MLYSTIHIWQFFWYFGTIFHCLSHSVDEDKVEIQILLPSLEFTCLYKYSRETGTLLMGYVNNSCKL